MLNKKYSLCLLGVLTLLGALISTISVNMFFMDLANKGAHMTILVSIPSWTFTILFVLGILYIIRLQKNPKIFRNISKLYLIIAMSLSFIGLLTSILGGLIEYGSLVSSYPFPGYLILFMVLKYI